MSTVKVNAASTVAASTQAEKAVIESCIRDMENICQAIQGIYPAINSNIPTSRFTNSEKEACNFIEAIQAAFVSAGNLLTSVIRKEVKHE